MAQSAASPPLESQRLPSNILKFPGFGDYSDNSTVAIPDSHLPSPSSSSPSKSCPPFSSCSSSTSKYELGTSSVSTSNPISKPSSKSRGSLSSSSLLKLRAPSDRLEGPTVQLRSKKLSVPSITISDFSSTFSNPSSAPTFMVDVSLLEIEPFTLPFKESSKMTPKCLTTSNPFIQQRGSGFLAPPRIDSRGKAVKPPTPILLRKVASLKPSKASTDLPSLSSGLLNPSKNTAVKSNPYIPWSKLTLPCSIKKNDEDLQKINDRPHGNGTVVTLSDYDYDEDWDRFDDEKKKTNLKLESEWHRRTLDLDKRLSWDLPTESTSTSHAPASTSVSRKAVPPTLSIDTNIKDRKSLKVRDLSDDEEDEEDEEFECQTPPDSPPSNIGRNGLSIKTSFNKTSKGSFVKSPSVFVNLPPPKMSNVPGRLRTNREGAWIMN